MFHLKVSPNKVISIPGNPKSTFGSPANASGKNSNIKYFSTVIRLLTITNKPPSRIHFDAPGCFSANPSHKPLIFSIILIPFSLDCETLLYSFGITFCIYVPLYLS